MSGAGLFTNPSVTPQSNPKWRLRLFASSNSL